MIIEENFYPLPLIEYEGEENPLEAEYNYWTNNKWWRK